MKKFLIFFPFLLLAEDYEFIVENPTMVGVYFNIFNTIAGYFGSESYLELLKIAFLLGGFFLFFSLVVGYFKDNTIISKSEGATKGLGSLFGYIFVATCMLIFIFSANKSTLTVKTKNFTPFCEINSQTTNPNTIQPEDYSSPSTGTVVGNIPTVLAWFFSSVNTIGRSATEMATMAFSNNDVNSSLSQNRGDYAYFLAGISIMMSANIDEFAQDQDKSKDGVFLGSALQALQADCILIPASKNTQTGTMVLDTFYNTGNFFETIDKYMTSSQLVKYKNPTDTIGVVIADNISIDGISPREHLVTIRTQTFTCGNLWGNISVNNLNNYRESNAIECSIGYKGLINPTTLEILTGDKSTSVVANSRDIILNVALMNTFMDARNSVAPGEISFYTGQSMSETVHKAIGGGIFMSKMLPNIQAGLRALLYAFFPLIFIIILMPKGTKVLTSYLLTLVWIELWAPTAAILNMFLSVVSTGKFQNIYQSAGLNHVNSLQILEDSYMMAGVAGYLFALVPGLTWLILKGAEDMFASMGSDFLALTSKNLDTANINENLSAIDKKKELERNGIISSVAQIEQQEQKLEANRQAGTFSAQNTQKDVLFDSAEGKTLRNIATNVAKKEIFSSENNTNAMIANRVSEDLSTIQEVKDLNFIDENGNIDNKNINKIAHSLGELKAIESQVKITTLESIGEEKIFESKMNTQLSNVGIGLSINKNLTAQLEGSRSDNKENISIATNDTKALMDAASKVSILGSAGKAYSSVSSDVQASLKTKAGISGSETGKIQTTLAMSELDKLSLMYDYFEAQKENEEQKGYEEVKGEEKMDKITEIGVGATARLVHGAMNLLATKTNQNFAEEFEKQKELMGEIKNPNNLQKAMIMYSTLANVNSSIIAYETVANMVSADQKNLKGLSASRSGKKAASAQHQDYITQATSTFGFTPTIEKMLGTSQGIQRLISLQKFIIEMIPDGPLKRKLLSAVKRKVSKLKRRMHKEFRQEIKYLRKKFQKMIQKSIVKKGIGGLALSATVARFLTSKTGGVAIAGTTYSLGAHSKMLEREAHYKSTAIEFSNALLKNEKLMPDEDGVLFTIMAAEKLDKNDFSPITFTVEENDKVFIHGGEGSVDTGYTLSDFQKDGKFGRIIFEEREYGRFSATSVLIEQFQLIISRSEDEEWAERRMKKVRNTLDSIAIRAEVDPYSGTEKDLRYDFALLASTTFSDAIDMFEDVSKDVALQAKKEIEEFSVSTEDFKKVGNVILNYNSMAIASRAILDATDYFSNVSYEQFKEDALHSANEAGETTKVIVTEVVETIVDMSNEIGEIGSRYMDIYGPEDNRTGEEKIKQMQKTSKMTLGGGGLFVGIEERMKAKENKEEKVLKKIEEIDDSEINPMTIKEIKEMLSLLVDEKD